MVRTPLQASEMGERSTNNAWQTQATLVITIATERECVVEVMAGEAVAAGSGNYANEDGTYCNTS